MNDKNEDKKIIVWNDTETMIEEELLEDDIYVEENEEDKKCTGCI